MTNLKDYHNTYIKIEGSDTKYYVTDYDLEKQLTDKIAELEQNSIAAVALHNKELEANLTSICNLRSKIAELKTAGDRMVDSIYWTDYGDCFECPHCSGLSHTRIDFKHDEDCPVTEWQKAKECNCKLDKEEAITDYWEER